MNAFVAALPMYDWPEARAETDRQWTRIRDALRAAGLDAPEELSRLNADLPTLWRHPRLLFAQACWGPMEFGLASSVEVVGQPDYSGFEGGEGILYSSVILMRREEGRVPVPPPGEGRPLLPVGLLRGRRLAFNAPDSMSGSLALERDLGSVGEGMTIFSGMVETGGHRASVRAVAEGLADVCAVDCRSWDMARRFEPAAGALVPVGWTGRRKGLPYIASARLPSEIIETVRAAIIGTQEL